jgi:hypothetical protein
MNDVTQFGLGDNMLQESTDATDSPHMLHALERSATLGGIRNIIMMTKVTIQTEAMVNILKRMATYCTAKTSVTTMLQNCTFLMMKQSPQTAIMFT